MVVVGCWVRERWDFEGRDSMDWDWDSNLVETDLESLGKVREDIVDFVDLNLEETDWERRDCVEEDIDC